VNGRSVIEWAKRPINMGLLITLVAIGLLMLLKLTGALDKLMGNDGSRPRSTVSADRESSGFNMTTSRASTDFGKVSQVRDVEPPAPTPQAPTPRPAPTAPPARREQPKSQPPPVLNVFTKPTTGNALDLAKRFAPYGRLVECELVMTIDSAYADTPIIGMVTKDLWHAGELVIPAGAEIHGRAVNKPVRDRIMTQQSWIVVWRDRSDDNGKELRLSGLALTKEALIGQDSWHLHDGSAGIRGEIIKSDEWDELMAYAAQFMATFAENLNQEEVTITDWGQTTTKPGGTKYAINEGIAAATREYATKLLDEVKNQGYFVRCPGGTEFYLYVTDIVNMNEATIAGTRINKN
jgi:hypothetical protein